MKNKANTITLREMLIRLGSISRVSNETLIVVSKDGKKCVHISWYSDDEDIGPQYAYDDREDPSRIIKHAAEIPKSGNPRGWKNIDLDSTEWEISKSSHKALIKEMECLVDDLVALFGGKNETK